MACTVLNTDARNAGVRAAARRASLGQSSDADQLSSGRPHDGNATVTGRRPGRVVGMPGGDGRLDVVADHGRRRPARAGADRRSSSSSPAAAPTAVAVPVALSNRAHCDAVALAPASRRPARSAAFANVSSPVSLEREVDQRVDRRQPRRAAPCRGASISVASCSRSPADRCSAPSRRSARMAASSKLRDDAAPPRTHRPARMLSNAGFGYSGFHCRGSKASPSKRPTDGGTSGIVDVHPRPRVEPERGQRQPAGLPLEDVLVARRDAAARRRCRCP